MSVISLTERMKRYEFLMQRDTDDEASGSGASSSGGSASTSEPKRKQRKPRCPAGSHRDRKTGKCLSNTTGLEVGERTPARAPKKRNARTRQPAPKATFVPYPTVSSTITTSKVIKLLYDGPSMSNKKFCWNLQQVAGIRARNKYEFSGITQMLYFPGGQILEDDILDLVDNYLINKGDLTMQRQTQQGGEAKPYQRDAAQRMGIGRWERTDRPNGFQDMTSRDLTVWGHPVKCRADGLTDTHVVEVKAPFGNLYKVWKSGEVIETDSRGVSWVTYDKDAEKFIIPSGYMAQILIEMNAYNRRKAYFGQLYSYQGWYSIAKYFDTQFQQIQRGGSYPFRRGTIVYTPCLDKSTPILTMVKRIITIVQSDTISLEVARAIVFNYLYDYCGCPSPPDGSFTTNNARANYLKLKPGESAAIEDWIEEKWRPRLDDIILFMTDAEPLRYYEFKLPDETVFKFTYHQIYSIRQEWIYGKKKDIMRGEVKADKNVLWDGRTISEPQLTDYKYVEGLKIMMKQLLNKVRRMNHKAWRRFKFPLMDNDYWGELPDLDDTMDEFVLLEVDLSENGRYEEAMAKLKGFFHSCEMVTQGLLPCKGGRPAMTGRTGADREPAGERDKFIDWLKTIPAKQVDRKELRI